MRGLSAHLSLLAGRSTSFDSGMVTTPKPIPSGSTKVVWVGLSCTTRHKEGISSAHRPSVSV